MTTVWKWGFFLILSVNLIGLFCTVAATCDCPHQYCMKMPSRTKRCECCIYVYLGKRSSQPTNRYQETEDMQPSKLLWPSFSGPALKGSPLSRFQDYKGYPEKLNDKAIVSLEMFNSKPFHEVNDKKLSEYYLKPEDRLNVDGVSYTDPSNIFEFSDDDSRD